MVRNTTARRERERLSRRELILEAARDLFLENGIHATGVDDIAAQCELAKGTIYRYFTSKDEIAFALLIQSTDELLAQLQKAIDPGLSVAEQLERLAVDYYRFFIAQPESFRYMFAVPHESYTGRVSDELLQRWADAGRAALSITANLLDRGVRAGELQVDDCWTAAVATWSAITGVIVVPSQDVRKPFIGEADVERMVIETARRLVAGMSPANATGHARGRKK